MMATEDRLKGKKTLKVRGVLEDIEKDEVKKRVDIITLFASFGVSLVQTGKGYKGRCPWHDDATPSLSVDREKGLYNCFGCGESGDVVTLVEKMKGYAFQEALDYLRNEYTASPMPPPTKQVPAETKEAARTDDVQTAKHLKPPASTPEQAQAATATHSELSLASVADYYQKKLLSSPVALAYLEKRGLNNPQIYSRFALGYADGSILAKVSAGQLAHLKDLGIVNANGYEHFKGCITFPLYDEAGQIVGMYGRSINASASCKHLYLPGGHKGLFNGKAARVYEELILTESIIDALSLIMLGIENVIPLYGTSGFTPEHLTALKAHPVKMVSIALDNDEPGRKAAEKLNTELMAAGFNVKVCCPTGVKDWNEGLNSDFTKEAVLSALAASEVFRPQADKETCKLTSEGHRYEVSFTNRSYALSGVKENFAASLRVSVILRHQERWHVDGVDLISARSRKSFAAEASLKTGLAAERIEADLLKIVELLEAEQAKRLAAQSGSPAYRLSEEEQALGMELLKNPKLFELIEEHTELLGYVGERINKLLVYIAASSRKLDDPISVTILSESAAGKSYLIDTIRKLIPPEDVVSITSLSEQALNYLAPEELLHKFLVMGEAVHGEVIEHQLREMLSAKELSRLVTTKDEQTGALSSKLVKKAVIVSAVMSSTNYDLNAENLSRSFVVNTDESIEQTRRIHELQRKKYTLERYREKAEAIPAIIKAHHAAQRLLAKRIIVNPFAARLKFPDRLLRARRDHERFMDLIACVCFLRQFQKEEQFTADGHAYITCDLNDYELAYQIMKAILPGTLTNFPKGAALLYETVRTLIKNKAVKEGLSPEDVAIGQRELREGAGLSQMFVKRNLRLLCEYEYLKASVGVKQNSKRSYQLVKDEELSLLDLSSIPTAAELAEEQLKF
jgi:DNA primase